VFKGPLASYNPSLTKTFKRSRFTVPIVEWATLMSFMVTVVTFGLRSIPSIGEVNPSYIFSKVRSIAVSLVPSAFSTTNYNPKSVSNYIEFSLAEKLSRDLMSNWISTNLSFPYLATIPGKNKSRD